MPRRGTERLTVRFTPAELARLLARAALVGLRPGPFLRKSALEVDLRGRLEGELLRRLGLLILAIEDHPERLEASLEDLRALLRELL
jgi:hypothetical protein